MNRKNKILAFIYIVAQQQGAFCQSIPETEFVSLPIQYDSEITITSAYIPTQTNQTRTLLIGKIQTTQTKEEFIDKKNIRNYAASFFKNHRPQETKGQLLNKSKSVDKQATDFLNALAHDIEAELTQNKIETISTSYLDTVFFNTLRSAFFSIGLTPSFVKDIDNAIAAYFDSYDIPISAIPTEMKAEYASRRINLMTSIQTILKKRSKDSMPLTEIEKMVENTYEAFIERAQYLYTWKWVKDELKTKRKTNDDNDVSQTSSMEEKENNKKLREFVPFLKKNIEKK